MCYTKYAKHTCLELDLLLVTHKVAWMLYLFRLLLSAGLMPPEQRGGCVFVPAEAIAPGRYDERARATVHNATGIP